MHDEYVSEALSTLRRATLELDTIIEELFQAAGWLENEKLRVLADRLSLRKWKILEGLAALEKKKPRG